MTMTTEDVEALEIAARWKDESAASFGPNKTLGILARSLLRHHRRHERRTRLSRASRKSSAR